MTTKTSSANNIKYGKVQIPNGELYFQSSGAGEPLILIHAGFSDHRDWQHQITAFGEKFNVITYDQRGSGNSSVPASAFMPAEDLKVLMDYLNISKAFLVGHSIGGTIALDFALQYPERVKALVLAASGLNGYSWSPEYQEWMKKIWDVLQPEEMTKQFLSAPLYAIAMSDPNIKSQIEMISKENLEKVLTWKTFDIQDIRWFFPQPKLNELTQPVLVVCGNKDSQDIQQIAGIVCDAIPKTKFVQIENADHCLNFEKPTEFNGSVLDFLKNNLLNIKE